ncbi:MAG: ankyrin repeat domain-containing protein [Verrucomicrobia bacterium]|nr:ankyrin repeat domain-containing protein [Verrucomicrobiota bacterium]
MKTALFVLVSAIVFGVCSGCHDYVRLSKNDRQLLIASGVGDTKAVRALLDQGADVNVRSFDGRKMTPLLWAVSQSHWETASVLIERGADVRAVDTSRISVVEYARDGRDDPKSAKCLEMIESRLNRSESQPSHVATKSP